MLAEWIPVRVYNASSRIDWNVGAEHLNRDSVGFIKNRADQICVQVYANKFFLRNFLLE